MTAIDMKPVLDPKAEVVAEIDKVENVIPEHPDAHLTDEERAANVSQVRRQ